MGLGEILGFGFGAVGFAAVGLSGLGFGVLGLRFHGLPFCFSSACGACGFLISYETCRIGRRVLQQYPSCREAG